MREPNTRLLYGLCMTFSFSSWSNTTLEDTRFCRWNPNWNQTTFSINNI